MMKFLIVFLTVVTLSGCTSRVILSTTDPANEEYDLSFGWLLVREVDKRELTLSESEGGYTEIINQALKADLNTKSCTVVDNSYKYYEPGCCATAKVICKDQIDIEHVSDSYNSSGARVPNYQYRLVK